MEEFRRVTGKQVEEFLAYLVREEKSERTVEKYGRDVRAFCAFLPVGKAVEKERVLAYKEHLVKRYAPSSVNSMLAAVNSFLGFLGREDCRVKKLKIQRRAFCPADRELNRAEYLRLIQAAEATGRSRTSLLLQTLGSSGIRVSETSAITVEALRQRFGPHSKACAAGREWRRRRCSPTICAICLPVLSTRRGTTSRSLRMCWGTAPSTPPVSIS